MQAPRKSRSAGRGTRTMSDLGVFFFHRFTDFVFEFLAGFFEFPHAATEAAGEFRELLGSKKQKNRQEDQHQFLRAESHDCEESGRIHLSVSLGCGLGVVKGNFRWGKPVTGDEFVLVKS